MSLERIAQVDKFFVQQKFAPLVNRYRVSTLSADGQHEGDELLAFVQQKRMKVREEVNIFADESQSQLLLQLKARKVFEFRGRTDVLLPDGTHLAQLQKEFGKSLLRSSWKVLDGAGSDRASAQEQSIFMAVLRRVWGWIPYVGDIPFFIPFHFEIVMNGQVVGTYRRLLWRWQDTYVLDLSMDTERHLDRRVAVAFAIALDALQDR